MLEKPAISDEKLSVTVQAIYGLMVAQVIFLPLGADVNTAVYQIITADNTAYFLKLRWGHFNEAAVLLPHFLHEQGLTTVIAPLKTMQQRLWHTWDDVTLILSPFVAGQDAYQTNLSDDHWVTLGATVKQLHAAHPSHFQSLLPKETYSPTYRDQVKAFLVQAATTPFHEPVAAKLAAFLNQERHAILQLVNCAEQLAHSLQDQPLEYVVCHADMHAGNVLIGVEGTLYLVDWDTLILAPKERDLMFVGGGLFANQRPPEQEEALFYAGYGQPALNRMALAYYRYERIVQDIAAYCHQLLASDDGGADREAGYHQLTSQFLPQGVIELAQRTEALLPLPSA